MKRIRLLILITTAVVLLAGCMRNATTAPSAAPQARSTQSTTQPGDAPDSMSSATPWVKDEENAAPVEGAIQTTAEAKRQAEAMEHALEALAEVDDADVVAIGRIALVGLEFADRYQGGLDERMKNAVLAQIQSVNRSINAVCVTADPALTKKIDALEDMLDDATDLSQIKQPFESLAQEAVFSLAKPL